MEEGFANSIVNSVDPTGHLLWNDQASDGRFRIEQYDCVSCIASDVGFYNYSNWTFYGCHNDNQKDVVWSEGYRQFKSQIIEADRIYNFSNVENRGTREHPDPWIWWRANDVNNRLWVPPMINVIMSEDTCQQGTIGLLWLRGQNRAESCYCGRPIPEVPVEPSPQQCNITLDAGSINTIGIHLGGIGLWIGLGAGIDAYLMFDKNDVNNYVVTGSELPLV